MIPKYPASDGNAFDFLMDHPEFNQEMANQNAWKEFEGKPDLANVSPEELRFIPKNAREGKSGDNIESWMLTE